MRADGAQPRTISIAAVPVTGTLPAHGGKFTTPFPTDDIIASGSFTIAPSTKRTRARRLKLAT